MSHALKKERGIANEKSGMVDFYDGSFMFFVS